MNKRVFCTLLALLMLLSAFTGCGKNAGTGEGASASDSASETTAATEETVPATVPADGNPDDVTCKGSYTENEIDADAVVATIGDAVLTNGQLQVYYWMEVAAYRQAEHENAPDFDQPLDSQACQIDDSVASWQQYFLRRALNTWHSAQALTLQSVDEGIPTEEAYQPNMDNHEEYMAGKPATSVLYGYNNNYRINTLHQEYLDNLPALVEELTRGTGFADASQADILAFAELYNKGYMYFTSLSYYVSPTEEEVEAFFTENEKAYETDGITKDSGKLVDMRHVLLVPELPAEEEEKTGSAKKDETEPTEAKVPETFTIAADGTVTCSEAMWEACLVKAREKLEEFNKIYTDNQRSSSKSTAEALFADFANKNSADASTALDGGLYQNIRKGQLTQALDEWCFDDARQPGDMEIIRTDCGYHIVFFCGSTDIWYAAAEADLTAQMQAQLILDAREKYPAQIDYSAIGLREAEEGSLTITASDLLYADVAHERYPEVQLYLQQDYPTTKYGAYKITSHGCGITTMAMVATYMADEELTPPTLCARYGKYCYVTGTDGSLFSVTPAEMGFYLKEKTFDWREAQAAMEEGYLVVCVQQKGFWTRGGHYLVLEKLVDGDEGEGKRIQVRDSNIYNYGRLHDHVRDSFTWSTVIPAGKCYWVYEKKITNIPACTRCGDPQGAAETLLTEDYICEKCEPAMLRRDTYLTAVGN